MKNVFLILFAAGVLYGGADDTFIMRGVTVHPVTAPKMENVSLLVRDGKIAEIGPKIVAPRGIREVLAKGLQVYPGLIDSSNTIGIYEIGSVRETADFTEIGDFNPQLRALTSVNAASEHIPVTRANGITATVTAPEGGLISGQAALIRLDGWTWEEMAIAGSAAMVLRFPELQTSGGTGRGPAAPRMTYAEAKRRYDQRIRELAEFFENARRYQRAKAQKAPDFETDLKFEAMLPVLDRKLPVLLHAGRERSIKDAVQFADREKLKIVLAGVRQPGDTLALLKARNIPVILGKVLDLPANEDEPYDEAFTLPARLHAAGVKFAFASFDTQFARNTPFNAATAVAFGLPYEEALKALTIYPAEIFGVADQIGSIEPGKWADLVVADGDPLETRTEIKQVYIRGKLMDMESKHTKLYKKYLARP